MNSIYSIGLFGMLTNILFLAVFIFGVIYVVKSTKERNFYLKEIFNKINNK